MEEPLRGIPFLNLEYFFLLIYNLLTGGGGAGVPDGVIAAWDVYKIVSIFASLLLLTGIVYSFIRLTQIRKEERETLHAIAEAATATSTSTAASPSQGQQRWEIVMQHISSDNPNDWRSAILEADIMLDGLVTKLGYFGDSLGEKMRQLSRANFQTIDLAWEAHRFRNRIAHEGAAFELSQREARRIIDLYRQVFEEFQYI